MNCSLLKRTYTRSRCAKMTYNRKDFALTVHKVFTHAFIKGGPSYRLYVIFGAILKLQYFFYLRIIEEMTRAAYLFYNDNTLEFFPTIKPLLIVGGIALLFTTLENIRNVYSIKVRKNIRTEYEISLRNKVSTLPWETYENFEYNMKIELINNRGEGGYSRLAMNLVDYLSNTIVRVAIFIYFISRLGILYGLIFTGLTVLFFVIGLYYGKKFYLNVRDNQKLYKQRTYSFKATANKEAHQDSLVNRLYKFLTKRWRSYNDEWMDFEIKNESKYLYYLGFPSLIFVLISIWVMYVVINQLSLGMIDIGFFTLILATIASYKFTVQDIALDINYYERDLNIFKDYLDIMSLPSEIKNNNKLLLDDYNIKFEDVTYQYIQSETKALNKLSISIKPHETIAIVGKNGSGKTTFVNLLMELSKRYDGRILVNDDDIKGELGIIRNSSSVILQDFVEYELTIRENISFGDISRTINDKELWEILQQVGLKDFVDSLPDKLNTMLGQINNGRQLSKGQWQKLAVARLLTNKKSKIWILDEPTAYLDPLAEIEMYDFIYNLKGSRTVIFISHRLGFSKKADRIIVFDDGHIIEEDTHANLMKKKSSLYKDMYNKQKTWYE